jgi:hypothetical protein
MSYVKLEVRSGGLVIKIDKKRHLQMNTINFNQNDIGIKLITESSIKGILSFLMGEKRKLSHPAVTKEHFELLELLFSTIKIEIVQDPFFTIFFERKDSWRYTKNIPINPRVSLSGLNWEDADPTIKLMKGPIIHGTGRTTLKECNKAIIESQNTFTQSLKKIKHIDDLNTNKDAKVFWDNIKKLTQELPQIKITSSKYRHNLSNIINSIKSLDLSDINSLKKSKLLNPIFLKILTQAANDLNATSQINQENEKPYKISALKEPNQTRHWVKNSHATQTRGGPGLIACINFNIWIENPPKLFIDLILNGPQMAYWGEGGIVSYRYIKAPIPLSALTNINNTPILNIKLLEKYKITLEKEKNGALRKFTKAASS